MRDTDYYNISLHDDFLKFESKEKYCNLHLYRYIKIFFGIVTYITLLSYSFSKTNILLF